MIAENGKDAAAKVRNYPRVKHHHKDAIRDVLEITKEDYFNLRTQTNKDPYFKCKNIQEQRKIVGLELLIEQEERREIKKAKNTEYRRKKQSEKEKMTNQFLQEYWESA